MVDVNVDAIVLQRIDQILPFQCVRDVEFVVISGGDVGADDDSAFGIKEIRGRFTNARRRTGDQGNSVFHPARHAGPGILKETITPLLGACSSNDGGNVLL